MDSPSPAAKTVFAGLTLGELLFCVPVLVVAGVVALLVTDNLAGQVAIPALVGLSCGVAIAAKRSRRS